MEQNRVAEHLGEILEIAYTRKISGLLRIVYAHTERLEEGILYILAGQPIYVQAGEKTGKEALAYLLTWRMLRFSYTPNVPQPTANLFYRVTIRQPTPPELLDQLVPRRTAEDQQTPLPRLTRQQRVIYCLTNGERTIAKLAQCSRKTVREVEQILQELQQMGAITV